MEMNTFDLIIVGGGAAGMMASISAKRAHPEYSVAIVDRTFALGRKILVCGAGRCNITNLNLNEQASSRYYGADESFVKSIFDRFGYKDIVEFFNDLGVELYVERKTDIGKLFPLTNQATTITGVLTDEIERLGIKVFLNTDVKNITKNGDEFVIKANEIERTGKPINDLTFSSKYLIISAGGKSYPALGSNGSGYTLIESFGHNIIKPIPSALPLEASHRLIHELQGLKMEAQVTSLINGKEVKTTTDEVMFTKYGLSGPAILNISREISIYYNREEKKNAFVKLNFMPGKTAEQVRKVLKERWEKRPEQTVEKSLYGLFTNKFSFALLRFILIDPNMPVKNLTEDLITKLVESITSTKIEISGTRGWNEAEFTAGGVDTREVNSENLESRLVKNLYFCGEIMDVDGDVGGFNLSWSWASGFIAGKLLPLIQV